MTGFEDVFSIVDSIVSLGILIAFTIGFIRGDIVSRQSVKEIIAATIDAYEEARRSRP
jgi:hypothetical protein